MAPKIQVTADLKDNVSKGLKKISSEGKKNIGGLGGAAKSLKGAMAALGPAVAAVGAAISVIGVAKLTKDMANLIDETNKLSQALGVSTKFWNEMDHVARLNGTSMNELQMGMKRLAKAANDARMGSAKMQDVFNELGVSIYDANGNMKDMESLTTEAMEGLAGLENQTKKVALAQEIFGRAGNKLIPILNNGSEAIKEQMQDAHALGVVFSEEMKNAAMDFNDQLFRMQQGFTGLKTRISLPIMQKAAEAFFYVAEAFKELIRLGRESSMFNFIGEMNFDLQFLSKTIISVGYAVSVAVKSFKLGFGTMFNIVKTTASAIVGSWNWMVDKIQIQNVLNKFTKMEIAQKGFVVSWWDNTRKMLAMGGELASSFDALELEKFFEAQARHYANSAVASERVYAQEIQKQLNQLKASIKKFKEDIKEAGITEEDLKLVDIKIESKTGQIFLQAKESSEKNFFEPVKKNWEQTALDAEEALSEMEQDAIAYWQSMERLSNVKFKPSEKPQGAPTRTIATTVDFSGDESAILAWEKMMIQTQLEVTSNLEQQQEKRLQLFRMYENTILSIIGTEAMKQIAAVNREEKEKLSILKQAYDEDIINFKEYQEIKSAIQKKASDERAAVEIKESEERAKIIIENLATVSSAVQAEYSKVNSALVESVEKRKHLLDEESDDRLEAIDRQEKAQEERIKNLNLTSREEKRMLDDNAKKAEERRREAKEDIEEKQLELAKKNKQIQMASIIIDTAAAFVTTLAAYSYPLNIVLAGITEAAGLAQLAIVSSQTFAEGGIVKGTGGVDSQTVKATPGEMFINDRQQAALFKAIKSGEFGGGGATINVGPTNVVIEGNADERVIREALEESREQQMLEFKRTYEELKYRGELA